MTIRALHLLFSLFWVLITVNVSGFPTSTGSKHVGERGNRYHHENSTLVPFLDKIRSEYVQKEIQQGMKLHKASEEARYLAKLLEQRAEEVQQRVLDLVNQKHQTQTVKDERLMMHKGKHKLPIGEDFMETHGNHMSINSDKKGMEDTEHHGETEGDSLGREHGMYHQRHRPISRDYKDGFDLSTADSVDHEKYDNDLGSHPVDRNLMAALRIASMQQKLRNHYDEPDEDHHFHHRLQTYYRHGNRNRQPVSEELAWYKTPDLLLQNEYEEE